MEVLRDFVIVKMWNQKMRLRNFVRDVNIIIILHVVEYRMANISFDANPVRFGRSIHLDMQCRHYKQNKRKKRKIRMIRHYSHSVFEVISHIQCFMKLFTLSVQCIYSNSVFYEIIQIQSFVNIYYISNLSVWWFHIRYCVCSY